MSQTMRPAFLLGLLLLFAPIAGTAEETPAASVQALHDALTAEFSSAGVTGAAVALVEDGRVAGTLAFGVADTSTGAAVTPATVFRVGSVGKTLVGLSVMMLVEEGRLDLEAPLSRLAPEIVFDNPWEATNPIRLKHLLEHTTGWADLSPREFALDDPSMTLLAGIQAGGTRVSRYPPGQYHAYSGAGHAIAAYIVEKTAGVPFARFVRARLFAPLQMRSASYQPVPGIARSYLPDGQATPYQHYPLYPSGGLNMSAEDLGRLTAFLAADGRRGAPALLGREALDRIRQARTTLAARSGLPHGYGLGVSGYVGRSTTLFGHGGAIDSFQALYRYEPAAQRGYAVMVNSGSVPVSVVRLLDRYAGDSGSPPVVTGVSADAAAGFAGTYQPIAHRNPMSPLIDGLSRFTTVGVDDGRLVIDGKEYAYLASGMLQAADRAAPTLLLVRTADGAELLGATQSLRRVSSASVYAKIAYAALAAVTLLAVLGALFVALVRRRMSRPLGVAFASLLPLLALLATMLSAASMPAPLSIARFGTPSWLSLSVFVLTVLLPVGAVASMVSALTPGGAPRLHRAIAMLSGVVLALASLYLLSHGWIGLRTWAIG